MILLSKEIITECEKFINKNLKQKDDLFEIVEAYSLLNDATGFEEFCFTGKYVNGLFRVVTNSSSIPEVTNIDLVKKDLSDNLEKINLELSRISNSLSTESKERIENKYLKLSRESLQNLKYLIEDLDHLKKYINHLKRES
jgi:hypothetical protein